MARVNPQSPWQWEGWARKTEKKWGVLGWGEGGWTANRVGCLGPRGPPQGFRLNAEGLG